MIKYETFIGEGHNLAVASRDANYQINQYLTNHPEMTPVREHVYVRASTGDGFCEFSITLVLYTPTDEQRDAFEVLDTLPANYWT